LDPTLKKREVQDYLASIQLYVTVYRQQAGRMIRNQLTANDKEGRNTDSVNSIMFYVRGGETQEVLPEREYMLS